VHVSPVCTDFFSLAAAIALADPPAFLGHSVDLWPFSPQPWQKVPVGFLEDSQLPGWCSHLQIMQGPCNFIMVPAPREFPPKPPRPAEDFTAR
jgi:hypothetical protein